MSDNSQIQDLFLNTKPVDLLMQLDKPNARHYASALSKDADVTYSHTVKCLQQMNQFDLVEFEKKGRKKEIELTDLGKELAHKFSQLRSSISEEEPIKEQGSNTDLF